MKLSNKYLSTLVWLGVGSSALVVAEARIWTDVSGKHKIEAEFVSLEAGKITLKKANGQTTTFPLANLSPADRAFAESLAGDVVTAPRNYEASGKTFLSYSSRGYYKLEVAIDLVGGVAADAFAVGPSVVDPVMIGGAELKRDKLLRPDSLRHIDRTGQSRMRGDHPEDGVRIWLPFGKLPEGTQKIEMIKGAAKVWTGGEADSVLIGDLLTRPDGPIEDPALKEAGLEVTFKREAVGAEQNITVSCKRRGVSGFAGIEIADAEGRRLPGSEELKKRDLIHLGIYESKAWGMVQRKASELEGKTLRIHFRVGAKEVELPFEVEGLKVNWKG